MSAHKTLSDDSHVGLDYDNKEMITIAVSRARSGASQGNTGPRMNRDIRGYRSCRLIGPDGSQLGIFDVHDALMQAEEQHLDLVEMNRDANPPVCKIMNYSKYRYEQQKKAKSNKRRAQETKQMKFRCKISDGDYQTKCRHIVRFLEAGSKVRIVIMFRGREMSHLDIGRNLLDRIAEDLKDDAIVLQRPSMDTPRDMVMVLGPTQEAIARGIQRRTEAQNRGKGKKGSNDSSDDSTEE